MDCLDTYFAKDDNEAEEVEHNHINDVLCANVYSDGFLRHMMLYKERNSDAKIMNEVSEQEVNQWEGSPTYKVLVNLSPTYLTLCRSG